MINTNCFDKFLGNSQYDEFKTFLVNFVATNFDMLTTTKQFQL